MYRILKELVLKYSIHGKVTFNRRVLMKQYRRLFLESLPRCTARQGPASSLASQAAKWLGM